ncbi:hotdog fold thioesterase [Persicitalea jodogahamensis]|uniref:4-hydroxybenzoyl-CoA thioesterase n=1 Tax=Persicitalea jodogahamensis TaxID=402147 RepID=A0A8J3D555_9BACT|nr:hotdog fold thioesterase [Persicitalea jodogahamensis]GHB76839.1 4-hydroxybenzoyl-CoA thioesterase [Persicitalea jodogahamensis]
MFNKSFDLGFLRNLNPNTIDKQLGIEFTEIGEDFITAKMPVDHRTHQPFGILHGGASVVLAESLGSVASLLSLPDPEKQRAVGLEISANHIRAVREGWVYGRVTALHVGRSTHVWDIKITNEAGKLVCVSRLTVAVIDAK